MNDAVSFLTRILPSQGNYCLWIRDTRGGRRTEFAPTIDALWARQQEWDACGAAVYHACASFQRPENDPPRTPRRERRLGRTGHNVAFLRSLWLDIDAGQAEAGKPPKPYPDARSAAGAVLSFCQAAQLPPPMLVSSGYGLHVYWPLQADLLPSEWKILANGLKALCVWHNLHADPARTADITSVLRTPGTHNRKGPQDRLVKCFQLVERYSLSHFQFLRKDQPESKRISLTVPDYLRNRERRDLLAAATLPSDRPAVYADQVAAQCAQLAAMRDSRGIMPEPLWYAALGVLAYCEDGDAKGQEWSAGYAGYSEAETAERLERAREFGPTTCERFASLTPDSAARCRSCALLGKIKSPIVAPRGLAEVPSAAPAAMNGHASAEAIFEPLVAGSARKFIRFPDTNDDGKPKATCANTAVAIQGLDIDCRQDVFHERLLVGGHPIAQWAGDLSDGAVLMLRKVIWRAFAFDPGERHARDAAMQLCLEHQFNPVTDYLGALRWDGVSRITTWPLRYLGAADNELHREFGRLMLIAAVRRARSPGCKFDQIVVLEGPQGIGKSSAIRILASEDNFSDQHILGASDREQQEAFRGVWLHEIAELAGMRRTDVERVKQFARRTEDRARPAYGRMRQDMKRRGIFVATTNEEEYLKEYDRAFWPIACGRVDLGGLRAARDQLWAEAALCEARGDSIELPERLRALAGEQQRERIEGDPWLQDVTKYLDKHGDNIGVHDVLTSPPLMIPSKDINRAMQMRIAKILKNLGFERFQVRNGPERHWIYKRSVSVGGSW